METLSWHKVETFSWHLTARAIDEEGAWRLVESVFGHDDGVSHLVPQAFRFVRELGPVFVSSMFEPPATAS